MVVSRYSYLFRVEVTLNRSQCPYYLCFIRSWVASWNRRFESSSWQKLHPLFFCSVFRRIWYFLCRFTSGMTFSLLFYVGWHFLVCFTSATTFSVLFYVGYDIFSAVLRRIWHFLCCFTSDMAFSLLFYLAYGIFDKNVSTRRIPIKCVNDSYLNRLKIIINLHLHKNIHFVPHREQCALVLQTAVCGLFMGKYWPLNTIIIRNTQMRVKNM